MMTARLNTLVRGHSWRAGALAFAFGLIGTPGVRAQTPPTFSACYVPTVGAIYFIKLPGLPNACLTAGHVEVTWTDAGGVSVKVGDAAGGDLAATYPNPTVARLQGLPVSATAPTASGQVLTWDGGAWAPSTPTPGVTDHGQLTGLTDDDHSLYLLGNGVRSTTNGFAVTGTLGTGTIPVEGAGIRLMWYPGKGAFRVGAACCNQWDDANVGTYSMALGYSATASGPGTVAFGSYTTASGWNSLATGYSSTASGYQSTAMGNTVASGSYTTTLGNNAVNAYYGSFLYGDASSRTTVYTFADNQFMVAAAGGTIFYSNAGLSTGVSLASGSGSWSSVSDRNEKEHFQDEDGERVLEAISHLPIQSWNYRSQDPAVRHLGPTAQDFRAAFGLGESDTTISVVDADGVNMLAAQALERRTAEDRASIEALRAENAALARRLAHLEAVLQQLTAARPGGTPR